MLLADDQAMIRRLRRPARNWSPTSGGRPGGRPPRRRSALAAERRPDVVLMDVQMPAGAGAVEDGITATGRIMAAQPATRVIILTTFGRPGYLRRAMEAGAVGFMVKDAPADQLIEGIRRVHRGLRVVDPTLAADSLSLGASPLTERETEVLGGRRQRRLDRRPSPRRCSSPRAPCATTCPRRWASSAPAPGPRPSGSPPRTAGSADQLLADPA